MARSGALVGLILVGLGALWWSTQPEPGPKFCTMGLAFTTIDGQQAVLQDQGGPGRDGCDRSDRPTSPSGGPSIGLDFVLGFDCKVRDIDGAVVATTEANRPDGTCGQGPRPSPPR